MCHLFLFLFFFLRIYVFFLFLFFFHSFLSSFSFLRHFEMNWAVLALSNSILIYTIQISFLIYTIFFTFIPPSLPPFPSSSSSFYLIISLSSHHHSFPSFLHFCINFVAHFFTPFSWSSFIFLFNRPKR